MLRYTGFDQQPWRTGVRWAKRGNRARRCCR